MTDPVMVRIGDHVDRRTRANDEAAGRTIAAVVEPMTDRGASLERRCIAGAQEGLGLALDQRDFAVEHINQFVLGAVPMLERREGTGFENFDERAELRQAGRIADPLRARRTTDIAWFSTSSHEVMWCDNRHA